MTNKYAVVTTITTVRKRYIIPMSDLQAMNPDAKVELQWAEDCVIMDEANPVSLKFLGETIVDTFEADVTDALKVLDEDMPDGIHPYEPIITLNVADKMEIINNWKKDSYDVHDFWQEQL